MLRKRGLVYLPQRYPADWHGHGSLLPELRAFLQHNFEAGHLRRGLVLRGVIGEFDWEEGTEPYCRAIERMPKIMEHLRPMPGGLSLTVATPADW